MIKALLLMICLPCILWAQNLIEFCDPPVRVHLIGHADQAESHSWYLNGSHISDALIESIVINDTGIYEVKLIVTDKLCEAKASKLVKVIGCSIFIPNAFTPNGDGINDVFEPKGINLNYHMTIYDRWGNVVYMGQTGWPGNNVQDVYTYKIIHKGKEIIGRVTLFQ